MKAQNPNLPAFFRSKLKRSPADHKIVTAAARRGDIPALTDP